LLSDDRDIAAVGGQPLRAHHADEPPALRIGRHAAARRGRSDRLAFCWTASGCGTRSGVVRVIVIF